jgi:hypothetical protein
MQSVWCLTWRFILSPLCFKGDLATRHPRVVCDPPVYVLRPMATSVNYVCGIKIAQWFRPLGTPLVMSSTHAVREPAHNNSCTLSRKKVEHACFKRLVGLDSTHAVSMTAISRWTVLFRLRYTFDRQDVSAFDFSPERSADITLAGVFLVVSDGWK